MLARSFGSRLKCDYSLHHDERVNERGERKSIGEPNDDDDGGFLNDESCK